MPVPHQLLPRQWLLPKLLPRDRVAAQIATFVAALDAGRPYRVTIEEAKSTRTNQQNRYLWSIYGHILKVGGEEMRGWTKDDLHTFFLGEFSGWDKRVLFGRTRLVPVRRSSRMNKQDFTDFVDSISSFMAQRGVYVPTPDDDWDAVLKDAEAA